MFGGFTDAMFEFFMAIRYNNNREFFHENHEWYEKSVRTPMRELAEALGGCIAEIDPELETRPEKVVSRINRDLRFSKDKSPYRDYLWAAYRRPSEERDSLPGFYFSVSCEGASYGMGLYYDNKPLMNALRRRINADPDSFCEIVRDVEADCAPHLSAMKRLAVPQDLPEDARRWYPIKNFYVEKEIADFTLIKSPALAQEIERGFRRIAPLYREIARLTPEVEP